MCELISRQAAIDAINALYYMTNAWLYCAVDAVMELPSAQPELIEKAAYIRGFEQGRTQGMIDAKVGRNE